MKGLLLSIPLLVFISPVNAFWGLSEEEKSICRDRASQERNEFSAKQAYNYCSKNIKAELKEKERKKKEREINYQRWYEEVGKNGCDKQKRELKDLKNRIKNNPTEPKRIKGELNGRMIEYIVDRDALSISASEDALYICKDNLERSKSDYGL